ncbi:PAAR-like domain-containing protein [Myxococcus sp. RHSTA-1-4]|uniref:PAAR-like domain-containing protein n=1 Tax=Myxococcus sp. RHSTA-1-4 TaxID=2874601 RepID=UPI001CBB68FF|nr:PAAR-like domain-containing protein [Myxococcus sp. RHSTA-1-4]MBZ4420424.1 DUF4150 domain-containing protein [Myxococcus sp. RHSTA-1-4]
MSGKSEVFINGLTPVTTESEGKVVGFPDVCKTPSPGGPVPIPFPNVAQSRDLENGSKSVRINGAPVALKDSYIGKSTGNEAGTAGGGVASGKTCGRAHPVTYSLGSSAVLGRNMLEGRELSTHPWYAGPFSLAAHHLICLEALNNEEWALICVLFGYHADRKPNGVFLPRKLALACQLMVAVHRGHHAEGFAFDLHLAYPDAVNSKLREVAAQLKRGRFCGAPEALVRRLDELSAEILARVERFTWTLTRDGLDYAPGASGCSGLTSIQQKPSHASCPKARKHGHVHAVTRLPLARRALKTGE